MEKIRSTIILAWVLVLLFTVSVVFFMGEKPSSKTVAPQTIAGETSPSPTAEEEKLAGEAIKYAVPEEGYEVKIKWGETGKKIVAAGAIDLEKYKKNYPADQYAQELDYLTATKNSITINKDNAYFWVNTLWALGLAQKSIVLANTMAEYENVSNLASTGGWTLGAKPAMEIYNSAEIINLNEQQDKRVLEISKNIYRPCCNNPTSFPDCNHGMAALGLIELMVSQGSSDAEIYRAVLAFNSYWFSQTYSDLAYYFKVKENTDWKNVDAKRVLSKEFSSQRGYINIRKQVGAVPGGSRSSSSCGA